jgi:hypothetical protein
MTRPTAWLLAIVWWGMSVLSVCGATPPKKVLIVHSFGGAAPPFTVHTSALEISLTKEMGEPVDIDHISLDMVRFAQPDMQEAFVVFLHNRLSTGQPDLVIAVGGAAAQFVGQYQQQLFPRTPIFYTGQEQRLLSSGSFEANAVILSQSQEFLAIGEDMLRLLPGTTNIVVVIGASSIEHYWVGVLRQELAPLTNRVSLTFLNDRSLVDALHQVAQLPPGSFILFGLYIRDVTGVT